MVKAWPFKRKRKTNAPVAAPAQQDLPAWATETTTEVAAIQAVNGTVAWNELNTGLLRTVATKLRESK